MFKSIWIQALVGILAAFGIIAIIIAGFILSADLIFLHEARVNTERQREQQRVAQPQPRAVPSPSPATPEKP